MYEFTQDIYTEMLDNWETWYITHNGYGALLSRRVHCV